jgi:hypothetical protein
LVLVTEELPALKRLKKGLVGQASLPVWLLGSLRLPTSAIIKQVLLFHFRLLNALR